MQRCQFCAQAVDDYDAHFPMCPAIRTAFDDSYGVPIRPALSVAEKKKRRNERIRLWRTRRTLRLEP